jgi:biotin carboxyl carrier protein
MKFSVKSSKTDANEVLVTVKDSQFNKGFELGAGIEVQTLQNTTNETHNAILVGDGLSYLVGHEVVRILPKSRKSKGGSQKIWHRGKPSPLWLHQKRPVEPKISAAQLGGGPLKSPMTGKVLSVLVQKGELVKEAQLLCTIEAMKMENQIKSDCEGVVEDVRVIVGNSVSTGEVLLVIKPKTA